MNPLVNTRELDILKSSFIVLFILLGILGVGSLLLPDIFWDGFLWKYFAGPVYADARGETIDNISEGYNPVNTLGYGLILSLSVYWIHTFLEGRNVDIDRRFALALIPYILLGSTLRVLEDADFFSEPVNYLMISPLIYIVVGLFTLFIVYLSVIFQDLSREMIRSRIMKPSWKGGRAESLLNLTWILLFTGYSLLFFAVNDSFLHIEHLIFALVVMGIVLFITKHLWWEALLIPLQGSVTINDEVKGTRDESDAAAWKIEDEGTKGEGTKGEVARDEVNKGEGTRGSPQERHGKNSVPKEDPGSVGNEVVVYHLFLGSVGWFCFLVSIYHLCWWGWNEADELLLHVIPGIVLMTIVAWGITLLFLRHVNNVKGLTIPTSLFGMNSLMIFSQFLDGAATFTGLDFYGYREKHVLPSFLIDLTGTAAVMFLLKFLVLLLAIYLLDVEYKREMAEHPKLLGLIKIVVIILGLAPGTRDMLRLAFGT